jgi:hypothetical protein
MFYRITERVKRRLAGSRRLGTPHPAGRRPLQESQYHQVVDRVQLAKGKPGTHASDAQALPHEHGQRAQAQADQVVRRPRRHHVGELSSQQDEERGQYEDRRDRHEHAGESINLLNA